MATTSDHVAMTLMALGENDGTWGVTQNANLVLLENAITDITTVTDTSGTKTLSAAEQVNSIIKCTATLVGNLSVETADTNVKNFMFWNDTAGAFTVTFLVNGQTGIEVAQGEAVWCRNNGTDIELIPLATLGTEGTVASSGTTDIWTGAGTTKHITGTTGITSFGTAPNAGAWMRVIFDDVLTLTDGANLNLMGASGGTITTAADDFAWVYAETTTLFKVIYFRENGTPIIGGALDMGGNEIAMNGGNLDFDDATGIRDGNGNEQLIFQETASAINHLEITNAASGGSPKIAAVGDDTDAYMDFESKGARGFTFRCTDGSTPGRIYLYDNDGSNNILVTPPGVVSSDATVTLPGVNTTFPTAQPAANDYMEVVTTAGVRSYVPSPLGQQTIWVPAGAMKLDGSNPPSSLTAVGPVGIAQFDVLYFDDGADEVVYFGFHMPKGWNEGTVIAQVIWISSAADTDGVAWSIAGSAYSDNTDFDIDIMGSEVVIQDDHNGQSNDINISPESGEITIGGVPAEEDFVLFRLFRDVSDVNDDMLEDAGLMGVKIHYTIDTANDS